MTTKKKVGTVLDEELLRRAKMAAAREGIPLSRLLEQALQAYIGREGKKTSIADEMWGAIRASSEVLKQVMEEEESALDMGHELAHHNNYPLRGMPFTYIDPTEPVAQEDWEAGS